MTNTLDADARWAAAAQLANGVVDDGVHRRRRVALTWITAVVLGSMLVGFALGFWMLSNDGGVSTTEESRGQRLLLTFIFLGLGSTVGIGGFIWAFRTKRYITRWSAVISPLNRSEKKSVRRQLAGKIPADEARLPVLVAIARQNQRVTEGIVPMLTAVVLINLAQSITGPDYFKYFSLVIGVLFVVTGVQLTVGYRRGAGFIQRYSAAETG
jgi:F0F1-type ATP synthase membrane subunit c/vacuolar-type H+-ATPase subunit K